MIEILFLKHPKQKALYLVIYVILQVYGLE